MDTKTIMKWTITTAAFILLGIAHYMFKIKNDTTLERVAEQVIHDETGLEINLDDTK